MRVNRIIQKITRSATYRWKLKKAQDELTEIIALESEGGKSEYRLDESMLPALTRVFKEYAIKYESESALYWLNSEEPLMKCFVSRAKEMIINAHSPEDKILDVCGGPGNLGIALYLNDYRNYILADVDELRMRWGELTARKFNIPMAWKKENALNMSFQNEQFDVVALLGWECSLLPYTYALKESLRVLKPQGSLIFTYHDIDGIIDGNWDFDPSRNYSYLPYSISRTGIQKLCERLNLEIIEDKNPGWGKVKEAFFPDDEARSFPQYIIHAKKIK